MFIILSPCGAGAGRAQGHLRRGVLDDLGLPPGAVLVLHLPGLPAVRPLGLLPAPQGQGPRPLAAPPT